MTATAPPVPVLAVEDLHVSFSAAPRPIRAVRGLSFTLNKGETLAIVGESGCGKSVTALSIMRLIPPRLGRIEAGRILFGGRDLARLGAAQMRDLRGRAISMIFQEPMTSLNPVLTVGFQIAEVLRRHDRLAPAAAWERAVELLDLVRIPAPRERAGDYPHQLSGGMRQRVMIAMALACAPEVLIADEPTTALDVTIQAQILDLMDDLKARLGTSIILITHDFGVVAESADRVVVMYAGQKIEEAPVARMFALPRHPYTRGLMAAIPRLRTGAAAAAPPSPLFELAGTVPRLDSDIAACAFAERCRHAVPRCRLEMPPLLAREGGHSVACWETDRVIAEAGMEDR